MRKIRILILLILCALPATFSCVNNRLESFRLKHYFNKISIVDNFVFTATINKTTFKGYGVPPDKGIQVFDISNPRNPLQIENIDDTNLCNDFFVESLLNGYQLYSTASTAYREDGGECVRRFILSSNCSPQLSSVMPFNDNTKFIYARAGTAYVYLLDEKFHIIDMTAPRPREIAVTERYSGVDYLCGENLLMAVCASNGLTVFSLEGALPRICAVYSIYGAAAVFNSVLYAFDGQNYLVVDLSNPFAPKELLRGAHHTKTRYNISDLAVNNRYIFAADSSHYVYVYDRVSFAFIRKIYNSSGVSHIAASETHLFVGNEYKGLKSFSI